MIQLLASCLIGLGTGLMAGTFGVGGGIVATPLLKVFMGFSAQVAIGTTLALILPTSLTGAINYYRQNLIDYKLALKLALPSVLAATGGAALTGSVSAKQLMLSFSGLIILAALDLLFGYSDGLKARRAKKAVSLTNESSQAESESRSDREIYISPTLSRALPVGLLAGFLSGFFGVGGGFIMIPIFLALFNMPLKMALGTSLLTVSLISIPGIITHAWLGHVRFDTVAMLVCGAVPGSYLGSKIAIMVKDKLLKKGFGLLMLLMAGQMIYSELQM
ncbi:MAG: sulfite exporter TauE/SafE family protein [Candidatus Obscuribacter phosphatis]|uniref:Probable membrane transporter protein n=1 Tax=Candidatus Obscuribacter phosphatis TaxID=1906157 RepID=A0A8J7PGE2_9BACT|nr:sulfite exporter TauE/SafE family protein [Candidatus Obscuribacter phosphatis]